MQVAGDGTDASGGPLPGAVVSNSAGPNDTATVSDFRISASDLDGSGAPNERVITFRITARGVVKFEVHRGNAKGKVVARFRHGFAKGKRTFVLPVRATWRFVVVIRVCRRKIAAKVIVLR